MKHDWQAGFEELYGGATVLRSKDLERRGLARDRIRQALVAGVLERVGRGLYARRGADLSEHHSLVQVARRVPNAARAIGKLVEDEVFSYLAKGGARPEGEEKDFITAILDLVRSQGQKRNG